MAHFAFVDGKAVINTVDLSAHCVSIDMAGETRFIEDGPCMSQLVMKELPVIKKGNASARFKQDFAGAQVHATLWPLWNNKTAHNIAFRPTSGAISATNPDITGAGVYIQNYQPIRGAFGEVPEVEVTWANVDIVEDTTP